MKYQVTIFLFVTILFVTEGFSILRSSIIKAKETEQRLAKVTDSLYVGKYEVTNKEFQAFLTYLSSNGQSVQAASFQSDSSSWLTHPDGIQMMKDYHRHELYMNYPVVGISHNAAQAYCEWLTKQYMADNKRKFKNVVFRLPTESEWQDAAWAGNKKNRYPWGNYLIRRTGESMSVYRRIGDQHIFYDSLAQTYSVLISHEEVNSWDEIPVYVESFWPNAFGIYHQSGNVAEMVKERGLAKGGSFNDSGYDIQITSRKYYSKPSIEVGFRTAMQVLP